MGSTSFGFEGTCVIGIAKGDGGMFAADGGTRQTSKRWSV
jgi:hypothetical protein